MQQHRAKKSLGQNFLKSSLALNKIMESGEVSTSDVVLEIGPGKGALTEKLLAKAGRVIAVEKDTELIEVLKVKFEKEIKKCSLLLVHGDILEFDLNSVAVKFSSGDDAVQDIPRKILQPHCFKVIANIPYNITGAILKKFLSADVQPERMVLMVQHEVAKRIMASDGKESLLSVSVKVYGEPKMVMKVPARYFSPAPKVDSAVILIKNISKELFRQDLKSEEEFWEVVKAGFAHKRKKLSGNLKKMTKINLPVELKDKRAEELSVMDWLKLLNTV